MVEYNRYRARTLSLRPEHVVALLTRGWAVAATSKGAVTFFVAALILATAAYWATMATSLPVTVATPIAGIMGAEINGIASRDAPTQDAGVIACTYVLTEGHRCN